MPFALFSATLAESDALCADRCSSCYRVSQIYTFTGSIVTSVNPCKAIPNLYDKGAMATSLADRSTTKAPEPHIFFTAETAYAALVSGSKDQSIIVSGISGAGKTEAIKYIMRYLCWRSEGDGDASGEALSQLVMVSNPVFEALGNATTVNNPNSSRFGKFIRLKFESGQVRGALIDTYLLEKSRLAAQQTGARRPLTVPQVWHRRSVAPPRMRRPLPRVGHCHVLATATCWPLPMLGYRHVLATATCWCLPPSAHPFCRQLRMRGRVAQASATSTSFTRC